MAMENMKMVDTKFLNSSVPNNEKYDIIPSNEYGDVVPVSSKNRKIMVGSSLVFLIALVLGTKQLLNNLYHESNISSIKFKNNYPKLSSLSYYTWDNIVEPNIETTLSIGMDASSSSECVWRITKEDGEVVGRYIGCGDIKHTFTKVSAIYTINVAYTGGFLSEQAVCKYVRREIRSLTGFDRTTYFSALELIYRLSIEEGQAQFGSNFKNYEYFTSKHLEASTGSAECFPFVGYFRGSNAFLTAHSSLTLELEQALQAIDPALSQPYWDPSIDSKLQSDWKTQSELFGYEYYGSISHLPSHVANNSRWFAFLPAPFTTSTTSASENSYGKLTDDINQDSSVYVTRGGTTVCSVDVTSELPSSKAFSICDNSWASLNAWRECIETKVHGYISLGGAWSCPFPLTNFPTSLQTLLGLNAVNIWNIGKRLDTVRCPSFCDPTTTLESCRCSCDAASSDAKALTLNAVMEFLYSVSSSWETYDDKEKIISLNDQGKYSFTSLSDSENDKVLSNLVTFICSPGVLGGLSTDAAPSDPLFWALHLMYDRVWASKRLKGQLQTSEWGVKVGACPGTNPSDVLPFAFGGSVSYMTNSELYDYFSPSNQQLPYIYDAF